MNALARPAAPNELAPYLTRVLAIGRPALRRLAALTPPPSLAATARRAVGLARAELRLLAEAERALRSSRDPERTLRSFQPRIDALVEREDALWRELEIPECAEEGAAGSPGGPEV